MEHTWYQSGKKHYLGCGRDPNEEEAVGEMMEEYENAILKSTSSCANDDACLANLTGLGITSEASLRACPGGTI